LRKKRKRTKDKRNLLFLEFVLYFFFSEIFSTKLLQRSNRKPFFSLFETTPNNTLITTKMMAMVPSRISSPSSSSASKSSLSSVAQRRLHLCQPHEQEHKKKMKKKNFRTKANEDNNDNSVNNNSFFSGVKYIHTLQENADTFVKHVQSYRITRVVDVDDDQKHLEEKNLRTTTRRRRRRNKNDIEIEDMMIEDDNNGEENYTLVCAQTYETDRETRDLVSMEIAQKGALLGSLMMEKVLERGWWDDATDAPSAGSAMDTSPMFEFQALKREQRRDLNATVRQAIEKELGRTVDFKALARNVIEKVFAEASGVLPNEILLTKQMTEDILRDVCASPKVSLYKNTLLYLSENEEEFAISSSRRDFSIQAEFEAKRFSSTNTNNLHPLAVVTLSIIEDMSVSLSEGITKAVLSTNAFGLVSNLKSSRILNKFRNQQRFSKFLFDNYRDVENIFSDRFELYGYYAETDRLIKRTLFMQRVNELEKLRGMRYLVSIVLEALDVFVPVLFQAWRNATKVATYLLMVVLGRSIGLVYRGIKDVVDDSRNRNNAF
tara:strand:- start:1207 stop:2850 length:1644 start_codon:yes stop_codon:yes gene_type:complete